MTKFRTDDKRAAVLITAATLALAILFTACPQKAKAKPAKPNVPSIFKTDGNGIIIGYTCEKDDLPKALVIPAKIGAEDITGIGYKAFQNCTGLTSLDLSGCASLTTIDMNAFKGCTGLTDVRFHENLAKIGVQAFNGCTGLTDVQFSESLTEIGRSAFEGCTVLKSLDLSGCTSLTTIGTYVFEGCKGLTDVQFPKSLTEIGQSAFKDCKGLTDVQFPKNFTKIGAQAFKGCMGLTDVQFPENLTAIGWRAFYDCTVLTRVIFEDKTGWAVYDDDKYNTKHADITSSDLNDFSKAAKYLREIPRNDGYSNKYWKKN